MSIFGTLKEVGVVLWEVEVLWVFGRYGGAGG